MRSPTGVMADEVVKTRQEGRPPVPKLQGRPPSCRWNPPCPPERPTRRVLRVVTRSLTVFVALMVIGNGVILGLSAWARTSTPIARLDIDGVRKAVAVDAHVWRGAAPTAEGYRNLAEAGVATIVDLRSDSERGSATAVLDDLDVRLVRIPIRDGQLPSAADVEHFVEVVNDSDGVVFVHCGAGVGRTGAMVAAYRAAVGERKGAAARQPRRRPAVARADRLRRVRRRRPVERRHRRQQGPRRPPPHLAQRHLSCA